jgi:hypothetical protein
MAISTMDQLVAALAAGQQKRFYKVSQSAKVAGAWTSFWKTAGEPGGGPNPSTGAGDVPTASTAGAIPWSNPSGSDVAYLARRYRRTTGCYPHTHRSSSGTPWSHSLEPRIRTSVRNWRVRTSGSAAATATRVLEAATSATGISTLSAAAIRWSQVVAGASVSWGQVFATAIRQRLAGGTIAGRVGAITAPGIRQRNAIAAASGASTAVCNPWIVAVGSITGAGTASSTSTRLRNATTTGAGHSSINTATGIRVALLTAETLDGTSTAQVDIWIYADGTALAEAVALAVPTGTWRAAATGLGVTTLDAVPSRIRTCLAVSAGTSSAAPRSDDSH